MGECLFTNQVVVRSSPVAVTKSCVFFKKLPLNTKQKFESLYHLIDGERLLSLVVEVVSFSPDKPFDFDGTTFSVLPSLSEVQ